jgi:hypothetical protein
MSDRHPVAPDDDLPEPVQLTPDDLAGEDEDISPTEVEYIAPDPQPVEDDEQETIELVDEEVVASNDGKPAISAFGSKSSLSKKKEEFNRPLNVTGAGATRCRLFHSRIAAAPLEYMENQINTWIDSDEIEIKHVGHVVGVMEGKTPEPNVIVMVWY